MASEFERHDDILQDIAAIAWALEAGAHDQARTAAHSALSRAQRLVGELIGDDPPAPGDLRRRA
jgi:hypothetical protein